MNKVFKKIKIKKLLENDEEQIKLKREINPILPRIDKHQVMLVLGGIGVGKSSLVANLIFSNEIYGYNGNTLYDYVFIISPTLHNDKNQFMYRDRSVENGGNFILFDRYSDDIIEGIMDFQRKKEGEIQPFSLLVMEDVMGTGTNNNHSKISELITKTRHYQLSIILIGQNINQAFSSTIKANTRQIFLKKMRNTKELKKFVEQYGDMFGGEEAFLKQYDYTFKGENTKYNFIYCNLDDLFCMKNFDELMYYNEELLI